MFSKLGGTKLRSIETFFFNLGTADLEEVQIYLPSMQSKIFKILPSTYSQPT